MKRFTAILCAGVLLANAGCGFKLRSQYAVPAAMSLTYVEGDPRSQIVIGLKRSLRSSAAQLAENKDQATAVVRVFNELTGRRALSVGSDGDVTEYEIFYSVSFQRSFAGRDAEPAKTLRLTRDYVFDSRGVLSSGEEEQTLRTEMRRDLVRLIMLRLQST